MLKNSQYNHEILRNVSLAMQFLFIYVLSRDGLNHKQIPTDEEADLVDMGVQNERGLGEKNKKHKI